MVMYWLSFVLGAVLVLPSSGENVENPKMQFRFYILTRGNFTQYVEKFIDPWLIFIAPTGRLFDDAHRESVRTRARSYRGLVKVGLFYVTSKDDSLLRKYGSIGFTELNEEWILCLPYGKQKDGSSSYLSEKRALRRCLKSIPATVHEMKSLTDLKELTFNAVVKFSPSRFVLLIITKQELDFMKVAAQRYKNYFIFATMDSKDWTERIASEYSVAMSEDVEGLMFLLFMERQPGKGFVKKAISVGSVNKITCYPDAIEMLFRLNIQFRRRLPGAYAAEDTCDPHQYMSGIMALEKRWFPRFIQSLDADIGCGSVIRKKLDSMSVPLDTAKSRSLKMEL